LEIKYFQSTIISGLRSTKGALNVFTDQRSNSGISGDQEMMFAIKMHYFVANVFFGFRAPKRPKLYFQTPCFQNDQNC